MIKTYILDTCTLLSSPDSLYAFEENTVIIPIGVIEELDKFKKDVTELGRNARQVSRELDSLRKMGDLREGVKLPTGGKIAVRYNGNLKSLYKEKNVDLHVIHIAQETIKKDKTTPCIIISLDVNVRIRANALGLQAEGYEKGSLKKHELDKGHDDLDLDEDLFDEFVDKKQLAVERIKGFKPTANYYYALRNEKDTKRTMLARVSVDRTVLRSLIGHPTGSIIKARNREQAFLIDALMDKDIKLVSVVGTAGTGKTLCSLAMGYYQTTDEKAYKRLLVSRPVYPMGKDIGFLPGEVSEKLDPWMSPIYDALEIICENKDNKNNKNKKEMTGRDIIKKLPWIMVEPLTYIRGRSIHNQFMLIDESQNLSPLEIKTIITRAGEDTKIVLTGDIYQIDNPYVDSLSNGLSVTMESFRGSHLAAGLILERGVRSQLAEQASEKL